MDVSLVVWYLSFHAITAKQSWIKLATGMTLNLIEPGDVPLVLFDFNSAEADSINPNTVCKNLTLFAKSFIVTTFVPATQ